jgi:hypothetical protein
VAKPKGGLTEWFGKGKGGDWVDIGAPKKDGKFQACGRASTNDSSRAYPKCVPRAEAKQMTASERKSAVERKRAKKQGVGGKPTNVATYARYGGAITIQARGCGAIMPSKQKRTRVPRS